MAKKNFDVRIGTLVIDSDKITRASVRNEGNSLDLVYEGRIGKEGISLFDKKYTIGLIEKWLLEQEIKVDDWRYGYED